jgi:sugar phosphate isomerase/epimerase
MKKPKIGFKTEYLFYNEKDKYDSNVIEITTKDKDVSYSMRSIEKVREAIKDKDASMHSITKRLFTYPKNKIYTEMCLDIIKAEIKLCRLLKIREMIIHLSQDKLTKKSEKQLREVINFAKKYGVELIYESNCNFSGKITINVLKKFPDLKYNLDLGHLNTSIGNKKLGMNLDNFLLNVRDRIVYIHAHNNNGKEDEHKSLDEGTLDWVHILDKLDLKKIRKIIMECRGGEAFRKTEKLLKNYLSKKQLSP